MNECVNVCMHVALQWTGMPSVCWIDSGSTTALIRLKRLLKMNSMIRASKMRASTVHKWPPLASVEAGTQIHSLRHSDSS